MLLGHSKGWLFPKGQGIKYDRTARSITSCSPAPPSRGRWVEQTQRWQSDEAKAQIIRWDYGEEADSVSSQQHESMDQVQMCWKQPGSVTAQRPLSKPTHHNQAGPRNTGCRWELGSGSNGCDGAADRCTCSIAETGTESTGRGKGGGPQGGCSGSLRPNGRLSPDALMRDLPHYAKLNYLQSEVQKCIHMNCCTSEFGKNLSYAVSLQHHEVLIPHCSARFYHHFLLECLEY